MKYADKSSFQIPYPASYYVRAFKHLDETDQCEFNCSAAIFGPFWMLYRKMYLWSLLVVLSLSVNYLFFCKAIISFSYFLDSNSRVKIIGWLLYQAVSAYLYGKYGNRLYYKHVKEKVSQGYYFTEGISATTSSGVVVAVAIFLPILALWSAYFIFKLLDLFIGEKITYDLQYVINVAGFLIFSSILFIYHKLDLLMLKKSQKNDRAGETDISKENIQKYLLLNENNVYVKVFNIVVSVTMLVTTYYTIMNWY